jgi:hypothetical protein
MTLTLTCPECQARTTTDQVAAASWRCAHCGFVVDTHPEAGGPELVNCRVCGCHELYIQKDFPHWLGMGIIAVACLASAVAYAFYWIKTTWALLIGSAVLDVLLYAVMGSVTVCYRCHAQYRGFPPTPAHKPFELANAEKYRQERLRREASRG